MTLAFIFLPFLAIIYLLIEVYKLKQTIKLHEKELLNHVDIINDIMDELRPLLK